MSLPELDLLQFPLQDLVLLQRHHLRFPDSNLLLHELHFLGLRLRQQLLQLGQFLQVFLTAAQAGGINGVKKKGVVGGGSLVMFVFEWTKNGVKFWVGWLLNGWICWLGIGFIDLLYELDKRWTER